MIIPVTTEHIHMGIKQDTCFCPIALALTAVGFTGVDVSESDIRFTHRLLPYRIWHGRAILDFIYDFDTGHAVQPFEIELNVHEEAV
jgi:hypothetical protein